jgi:hypothetical protein
MKCKYCGSPVDRFQCEKGKVIYTCGTYWTRHSKGRSCLCLFRSDDLKERAKK